MSNQPHKPSGSPAGSGGEFASKQRQQVDIDLGGAADGEAMSDGVGWQVGDEAILLTRDFYGHGRSKFRIVQVVAVSPAELVLSNHVRVSASGQVAGRPDTTLHHPHDPEVAAARAADDVATALYREVDAAYTKWHGQQTLQNAQVLDGALKVWIEASKS